MRKHIVNAVLAIMVLAGMALPFAHPQPVYAATDTLTVSGDGTDTQGSYVGGAANYTNLNSDDGDTTYWWRSDPDLGVAEHKSWNYTDSTVSASSINSVTVYYKVRDNQCGYASYDFTPYVLLTGTRYYGTTVEYVDCNWVTVSKTWSVNPATGTAWTLSQINGAEFGIKYMKVAGGYPDDPLCTYSYLVIDYTSYAAPTVTTGAVTNITDTTATGNGNVTSDGGSAITERGTVISTSANPTTADTKDLASGTTGAFTTSIDGLTKGTTYHVRAYAINSIGTSYGSDVSFTTLDDPAITTNAATNVAATSARLNSLITDDGGQACDVRFQYGTSAGVYTTNTTWVENTYVTGNTPYVDISGLTASTTYYFRAQIRNDVSTKDGAECNFTTESGIYAPTGFKGIPTGVSVALQWTKGTGTTNTLVNRKLGSYPASITDGVRVYFDTETSTVDTGLSAGTTYYYKAWGESGGTYSTGNATLMVTTLAATAGGAELPVPPTPNMWYQSPDHTTMANFPLYDMINWGFECFGMPLGTGWFLIAITLTVIAGILAYTINHNLVLATVATGVAIVIFSVVKLMPLWLIVPYVVLAVTGIMVGERR